MELVVPVAEPKIYRETSIIVQKEPEEVPCIVEKPVVVEVKLPPRSSTWTSLRITSWRGSWRCPRW